MFAWSVFCRVVTLASFSSSSTFSSLPFVVFLRFPLFYLLRFYSILPVRLLKVSGIDVIEIVKCHFLGIDRH